MPPAIDTAAAPLAATHAARRCSVIVPARAGTRTLDRCLAALASATPPPAEVIVVIDGSDAALATLARSLGAAVLELPERRGAPAARNAGVARSSGDVLMFVDADVVIAPDAVGQALAALDERPEWSAVFGSYDDRPEPATFVAQYKGLLNHYTHQRGAGEASTFWTAMGAIRRDAFLAVGGFDPAQRLEDIELGYRLRAAGHRIGLRHTMLATHLKRWTAASVLRSDFFDRALPWTELMLRHGRSDNDLNLDWRNRGSVLCVGALCLAALLAWPAPAVAATVAALAAVALVAMNWPLYRFLAAKRGVAFALAAIPWHWLYFLYGGVAFACGLVRHATRRRPAAMTPAGALS